MTRVLIFGDEVGVPQLLEHVPSVHVIGIVAAGNRPQYHDSLLTLATTAGLPLLIQPLPSHLDYAAFVSALRELRPELILVSSYSMILKPEVLALPTLGALNLHGALLPRYRGSNPIQWAILNGETRTGMTLHEVSAQVDQGPIVAQSEVPLHFEDTWIDVRARLFEAANSLLAEHMASLLAGIWHATPQDEGKAFVTRRRTPDDGRFTWDDALIHIYNLIRALVAPLPGAFFESKLGRTTIDQFVSLPELVALRAANRPIESDGFTLCPILPDKVRHGAPRELWFSMTGPADSVFRGCVGSIDWYARTAAITIAADGRTAKGAVIGHAMSALSKFSSKELMLSAVELEEQIA